MSQTIQISEDKQYYVLNGTRYHISFPLTIALDHAQSARSSNVTMRKNNATKLKYHDNYDGEDYFETFLSRLSSGENSPVNSIYDEVFDLSEDDEPMHYVSEASENEEESSQEDQEEDKENIAQDPFYKIDQAFHLGRITSREKLFNTQYLCCNN